MPSALLRLYEYEMEFDSNLSPSFVALCQYDETLFSPELISQMLRIHPKVVTRGKLLENPFYVGPSSNIAQCPRVNLWDLTSTPSSPVGI